MALTQQQIIAQMLAGQQGQQQPPMPQPPMPMAPPMQQQPMMQPPPQQQLRGIPQPQQANAFMGGDFDVAGPPVENTRAQDKLDDQYVKSYMDWRVEGGDTDVRKMLAQLSGVMGQLKGSDDLTGPFVGNVPNFLSEIFNPEAVALRESVEEVVQRNLRAILGAQFTEKEGTRLISRAFNPKLQESENLARVTRLFNQMDQAAQTQDEAANYFEQHGTLAGWVGKLPDIDDFDPDATTGDTSGVPESFPDSQEVWDQLSEEDRQLWAN